MDPSHYFVSSVEEGVGKRRMIAGFAVFGILTGVKGVFKEAGEWYAILENSERNTDHLQLLVYGLKLSFEVENLPHQLIISNRNFLGGRQDPSHYFVSSVEEGVGKRRMIAEFAVFGVLTGVKGVFKEAGEWYAILENCEWNTDHLPAEFVDYMYNTPNPEGEELLSPVP
ncbi:hypothetical protein PTKIN_Ptkin05aG0073500 [Pterospermum kingtungense]